jgi:hypothetical protein
MKKVLFLFLALLLLFVCAVCVCAAPADRPYQEDEGTRIVDGVVYQMNGPAEWMVADYFATNEIAETATAIHIVPEIDGKPVTSILGFAGGLWYKNGTYRNVTEITLPDTLRCLGYACFSALDGVKTLVIPASVRNFGFEEDQPPFWKMDSLETVRILAPINTIGERWFEGCKSLKKVTWKGKLTGIHQNAFKDCKNLRSFKVPDTVKTIGGDAFKNSGLVSVKLPADISFYGHEQSRGSIFAGCTQLKKVVFTEPAPKELTLPENMFDGCTSLTSVTLPDTVKRVDLEWRTFHNCTALKKLSFDSRIYWMSDESFRGCASLASFTIGKKHSYHMTVGDHRVIKVTRQIPPTTFKGCKALKKLRVLTTDPSFLWVDHRFIYTLPKDCRIYVRTADMKQAFLDKGCTNKVIVKADLK